MKKILLTLIVILSNANIKAQTLSETVDYINANTLNYVFFNKKFASQCSENYFQFPKSIDTNTEEINRVERIYLKDIKAISYSADNLCFQIVVMGNGISLSLDKGEFINDNKKIVQTTQCLSLNTPVENIKRIIKAMKHAAKLGGAKLINEDLFKD